MRAPDADPPAAGAEAAPDDRAHTATIVILSMTAFASSASLRAADTLLPAVAGEFAVTAGAAAVIVTVFSVFYGAVQFVAGPVGDRIGKLRVIAAGCALSAVASVLCAAAPGLGWLSAARGLAGFAAGAVIPLAMAWIGDAVPFERRQPVLARFLLGQVFGLAFGQAMSGVIAETVGWRAMFAVLAVLFSAGAAAVLVGLRRDPGSPPPRTGPPTRLAEVLSRPHVRLVLAAVFLEGTILYLAFAFAASDLHLRGGYSLAAAGAAVAAFALGGLLYILPVGRIVEVIGRPRLPILGAAVQAAGFLMLAAAPTFLVAVPALVLVGWGFYAFHNTLQTEATQMVPAARGLAVSLFAAMLFAGQAAGVAVGGAVFDRFGAVPLHVAAAVGLPLLAWWFSRGLPRAAAAR